MLIIRPRNQDGEEFLLRENMSINLDAGMKGMYGTVNGPLSVIRIKSLMKWFNKSEYLYWMDRRVDFSG